MTSISISFLDLSSTNLKSRYSSILGGSGLRGLLRRLHLILSWWAAMNKGSPWHRAAKCPCLLHRKHEFKRCVISMEIHATSLSTLTKIRDKTFFSRSPSMQTWKTRRLVQSILQGGKRTWSKVFAISTNHWICSEVRTGKCTTPYNTLIHSHDHLHFQSIWNNRFL